jgi:hypothetical protein
MGVSLLTLQGGLAVARQDQPVARAGAIGTVGRIAVGADAIFAVPIARVHGDAERATPGNQSCQKICP